MRQLGVPHQLGFPHEKISTAEIRFVNEKGQTEVWVFRLDQSQSPDGLFSELCNRVWMAYLDDGVDSRLANQAAAISRLVEHLQVHHAQLNMGTAEDCPVMNPTKEEAA